VPQKPERDESMNQVAQLLRGRKYNEALALLRKALQSTGSSPRVNTYRVWISFIEARKFAAAKDFDTAVEKYQAVLDLDPNHAAAQREILMARCMLK
jgi:tetratricopeptide (TPR) repeat protein